MIALMTGITWQHRRYDSGVGRAYLAWWTMILVSVLVTLIKALGWLPPGPSPDILPTLLGVVAASVSLTWALYHKVSMVTQEAAAAQQPLIAQQRGESIRLRQAVQEETLALRLALVKAEQTSKEKSGLVSMMAHELRAPLHAILAYAQLLRQESQGKAVTRIDVIERNGRRLHQMLDQAFDYSRGTTTVVELESGPVDLQASLQQFVTDYQPATGSAFNGVILALSGQTPACVLVDKQRLLQVLQNIVGNACKYTTGGPIRVDVEALDTWLDPGPADSHPKPLHRLRFSVRDQQRIFEPFTRLASTRVPTSTSQTVRAVMALPPAEALAPLGGMLALGQVLGIQKWIAAFRADHEEWAEFLQAAEQCCERVDLPGLERLLALSGITRLSGAVQKP